MIIRISKKNRQHNGQTKKGYYEAASRDTGITSILPESSSICNTGTDTGKYKSTKEQTTIYKTYI
jgi:hypothetical protein